MNPQGDRILQLKSVDDRTGKKLEKSQSEDRRKKVSSFLGQKVWSLSTESAEKHPKLMKGNSVGFLRMERFNGSFSFDNETEVNCFKFSFLGQIYRNHLEKMEKEMVEKNSF